MALSLLSACGLRALDRARSAVPGYRQHWLFQNALLGSVQSTSRPPAAPQPAVLALRTLRAAVIVPDRRRTVLARVADALADRRRISRRFRSAPLSRFRSGWWRVLFASEHGPYWESAWPRAVLYNWWMVRTRSLGDLILAHAVTNACLSAYVILAGKWEYWLVN